MAHSPQVYDPGRAPVASADLLLSRIHGRYGLSVVAVAGILVTFGLMTALDLGSTLGTTAYTPWVGLIGFDLGSIAAIVAGAGAMGLRIVAGYANGAHLSGAQIAIRLGILVVLGTSAGVAGRRLRKSARALGSTSALQSALIDATLDGICLTDESGRILITNAPLRRISAELRLPEHGTVPERLFAIADRLTEPDRFRKRMLELASSRGAATTDEFELAATGRVFRGYTAPVSLPDGSFAGRIWTLREVTADREL
ncbi:MAG: PAS domain-containing protein, partial [Gaiellaceae bacterium]